MPARQRVVEDHAADRGVDHLALELLGLGVHHVLVVVDRGEVDQLAGVEQAHGRQRLHLLVLERDHHVLGAAERAALALGALLLLGEVVAAEHDVLARDRDRLTVRGREDVVRAQHQDARLDLRLGRQRHVHGHLVAVEVGVERRADERVDLDRLALDQHRLEGLDAEAVERGRAVQQHRVLADDFLQEVPHLGPLLLDHLLGGLDRRDQAFLLELVVDERLEQLERHLLRQAALVQLQLRADHDHGAARVVDALAEQVLAEAALLALERVGERLERPVVGPAQHAAAAAVVEERVHRFLQHALLVAHDHVGRAQLDQLLQPVVAVDHAAVEVVQVGGREAPAVEGHERPELGRDHRDRVQDHPLRLVAALAEGLDDLEPLGELDLLLDRGLGLHPLAQVERVLVDVDPAQQLLDRLGAHRAAQARVLLAQHAVALVGDELVQLDLGQSPTSITTYDSKYRIRSRSRSEMSRMWPMRLGRPLKNQTWLTGQASSMWPMRSRRTFDCVTSTPHLSQITPRCFMRLYLPHRHSQSVIGPKILAQNSPSRSGLNVR